MNFETDHIYHIFNRGNNSQRIFFNRNNYLFFLEKVKQYVLPYSDILAWCLMPTHFHLMVWVNSVELMLGEQVIPSNIEGFTRSETLNKTKARTFNQSIGVMLRSYSRAIQLQESRSGSLFQKETKAICLSEIDGVSRAWFDTQFGTQINITLPEREYPQVCFNYIHSNPVVDGLVRHGRDWEFSSARDYEGIRNGKLVDRAMMTALGLEYRASL